MDNEKQEIIRTDFLNKKTIVSIVSETGVSNYAVVKLLKQLGIYEKRENRPRKYHFNEYFFEKIDTEEKAYWLGFIAADGYVQSNYRRMVIELSSKDKEHVFKFRDAISGNMPIVEIIQRVKPGHNYSFRKEFYYRHGIDVCSKILCHHLKRLGVTNKKSLTLEFPKNLDKELLRHFIRGYFDGDGSWILGKVKNRTSSLNFSVISNEHFCLDLQQVLMEKCQLNKTKFVKDGNCMAVRYGGSRQCKRIRDFLYKDATIFLERKKDKAYSVE